MCRHEKQYRILCSGRGLLIALGPEPNRRPEALLLNDVKSREPEELWSQLCDVGSEQSEPGFRVGSDQNSESVCLNDLPVITASRKMKICRVFMDHVGSVSVPRSTSRNIERHMSSIFRSISASGTSFAVGEIGSSKVFQKASICLDSLIAIRTSFSASWWAAKALPRMTESADHFRGWNGSCAVCAPFRVR